MGEGVVEGETGGFLVGVRLFFMFLDCKILLAFLILLGDEEEVILVLSGWMFVFQ